MKRLHQALFRYFPMNDRSKIGDMLHAYGDPKQALLCYRLFWPEFSVIGGEVMLKDAVESNGGPDRVEAILARSSEGRAKALRLFRSLELSYVFIDPLQHQEDYQLLGELLVETWSAALARRFPNLRFDVKLLDEEQTGSSIAVGFEQQPLPVKETETQGVPPVQKRRANEF